MKVQRFGDTGGERRVKALQVGLAVGLAVLVVLAEWSTALSVQLPVLLLVLVGALLTERRQRGPLQPIARPPAAAAPLGGARPPGPRRRIWRWLQRQISEGVVHGHEEGERCNDLCRRTRATSGSGRRAGSPSPTAPPGAGAEGVFSRPSAGAR